MNALTEQISQRITDAQHSLHAARAMGDEYLVDLREGEIASLTQIAHEHNLAIPGLI